MPSPWDNTAELKLLLVIIELLNPKTPSWPLVAEKMGPTFTNEACRQHFQKLKRESRNSADPTTPSRSNGAKTPTPKSKAAKRQASVAQDDEELELLDDVPRMKKLKPDPEQSAILFKIEDPTAGHVVDLVSEDGLYE
ncbi:MAG: hypothetical protein M1838_000010 [Thelocarpon superellum]|nr:MAG: hypothetical protein M1838_000010 [Thelocarpon superellum]